jgi:hypothetical protein
MLIAPSVTKRLTDERASQGAWAEARQMCNLFVCIAVEFIVATRNFVRGKYGGVMQKCCRQENSHRLMPLVGTHPDN